MDLKDFKEGLISLALLLFFFSFTLILLSFILRSYIGLEVQERDFVVILCAVNILFSFYYLLNAIRLEKIFKLENKNVLKFGKTIGIITLIYTFHLLLLTSLFLRNLQDLGIILIFFIFLVEIILIVFVCKEVYDLLFLEKSQRNFELDANRKKYIDKEKQLLPSELF
ncbi:MAG: hypothetical protein ACFFC3_07705 [Candidatus Odinarchaeota archaeon]